MAYPRDRRNDLRPSEEALTERLAPIVAAEVDRVVNHVMADRASLKKNGHTWPQWFGKVLTVDRLILVAVAVFSFVFNFGGQISDARRELKTAAQQATTASQVAAVAASKSEDAAQKSQDATAEMLKMRTELTDVIAAMKKQQAVSDGLNERISLNVSRNEFRAALTQQVLPRLERIEKKVEAK